MTRSRARQAGSTEAAPQKQTTSKPTRKPAKVGQKASKRSLLPQSDDAVHAVVKANKAWQACQSCPPAACNGPSRKLEHQLRAQGYQHIGGLDEAGRGPLAGPVVAAVCVIPEDVTIPGIDDSKKLDESQREDLYAALTSHPQVLWAVHSVEHAEIDDINILQAAMLAMRKAAVQLPPNMLDYLLVDGNQVPKDLPVPAQCVIKGDAKCVNIAAASIIAKVTRDRLMVQYDKQYPGYGFAQHKGYAVPSHYAAIRALGPCHIHRCSFEPIKGLTGWSRAIAAATAAATHAAADMAGAAEVAGAAGATGAAGAAANNESSSGMEEEAAKPGTTTVQTVTAVAAAAAQAELGAGQDVFQGPLQPVLAVA